MRPKRALLAYCALAQRLNTEKMGIMQALTPFLGEACEQFSGELFDAAKFSSAIEANYGLTIPRLAALGLAEQLCDAGILEASSKTTSGSVVYKYATRIRADAMQSIAPLTEREIENVLQSFSDFCAADPKLKEKNREWLDAAFLERLLNIDSMKLLSRREASISLKKTTDTIVVTKPASEPGANDKQALHLDYLASQYLLDLRDKNPAAFELVSNVAFANMAAEAIACLREPNGGQSNLQSLTVYLDAPLLLDMLNVNTEYTEYGLELLGCIKKSGATPAILDHCVSEAETAVHAHLSYQRSGVNKFSSRLGVSVTADLLSALRGNVGERAETRLGIKLVRGPDINLHRKAPHAVGDIEANMNASMKAWNNAEAKEYDRKSVWSMLEMRDSSAPCPRICDSKHLFVTRNVVLVKIANRQWTTYLNGATKHSANTIERWAPVAMSDKQFAGYVWIRSGGTFSEVSRARLLAHCSAAIRPRADIKARAYNLVLELSGQENADDIAALLEDKEGGKALMRATKGDPEDVTLERLPYIIEEVKLAAGEFAAKRVREESAQAQIQRDAEHQAELDKLRLASMAVEDASEARAQAVQSALVQEKLEREAVAEQNISLRNSLLDKERAEEGRKTQILQEAFDVGARAYERTRWLVALLIGLITALASLYSTENPFLSAAISALLGLVIFLYPPEVRLLNYVSMKYVRRTVLQRDAKVEIPESIPDFRNKRWLALDALATTKTSG